MRIAIIGRTEILYDTAIQLQQAGHDIACILTAKQAPEYTRTATDFNDLATQWKIPFAQGPRIIEHSDFLKSSESRVALSFNYPGIVPQEVINIFPLGILNAHGGDLPRYRGNACQAWAIINGEERIGLCVHRMVGGELDSGDIIARTYLPIDHTTKVTKVWEWMHSQVPDLFVQAVNSLANNPDFILERQSKNPKDALRCYPRKPEDGEINWSRPAIDVLRLINASNKPYSGAFCNFKTTRITVWNAELIEDDETFCAVPGQVIRLGDGWIDVACANGKLRILQCEINGVMGPPQNWINSVRERLA